jgi:glycosyltransferase involved in cell wall biosynthesis
MNILHGLYYYRPHFSGLTLYTERLAREFARRGHEVAVLTSQFDPGLPREEQMDGVTVRRAPVLFRLCKGPIMPTYILEAIRLLRQADVVHLHVPQLDAAPIALAARLLKKPVVLTYHCDLSLPTSPLNRLANLASQWANHITARAASIVITNSQDYAEVSSFLSRFLNKIVAIPPPNQVEPVDLRLVKKLEREIDKQPGDILIGMAARLATEKGAEVLARALSLVMQDFPQARVIYFGQHENVLGEEAYARKLAPLLDELGDHWTFLGGGLSEAEKAAFFAMCDVTVLPSLNSTESFGMVQIESMLCGTPVVASDLPGVRQPTTRTGMGVTSPPGDEVQLAQSILKILGRPGDFFLSREEIETSYSTSAVADQYEEMYRHLLEELP